MEEFDRIGDLNSPSIKSEPATQAVTVFNLTIVEQLYVGI